MKTTNLIVIATALFALSPLAARAGGSVGNGGDVLVDMAGNVQLVDFYEAETLRGMKIDLGAPTLDPSTKVANALLPLKTLSPARYAQYKSRLDTFFSDALLLPNAKLEKIDDVNLPVIPDGWTMVQIAIQKEPDFPEDKVYTINEDLWNKLDNDGKAGLILHEIVYRETKFWETTSETARYFATSLASHKFDGMSVPAFVDFLENVVHFHSVDVAGIMYDLTQNVPNGCQGLQFYPSGAVQCGWVTQGSLALPGASAPVAVEGATAFAADGSVSSTTLAENATLKVGANIVSLPSTSQLSWKNGALNTTTYAPGSATVAVTGPSVNLSVTAADPTSYVGANLGFSRSGALLSFTGPSSTTTIGTVTYGGNTVSVASPLTLNADGSIDTATIAQGTKFNQATSVITMDDVVGSVTFGPGQTVVSCMGCEGTFQIAGQPVTVSSYGFSSAFPLTIYPNGMPESGITASAVVQGTAVEINQNTKTLFNEKGIPVSFTIENSYAQLQAGGHPVNFTGVLGFYDDGNTVKTGTLYENTNLTLTSGQIKTFFANSTLQFDLQGRVIDNP